MEDNEFIPKSEPKIEDPNPKVKQKKEDKKEKKAPLVKISFFEKIDKQKLKVIFGSILSLLSIYLFLACVSYIFTWEVDQDKLLNRSFSDFLFDSEIPAAENWLGKFGAWASSV